ncbi:MAG TPA: hypothetical protein VMZ06_17510 [Candidatus Bathyarchaeia archaeon]|nr:hypothetical protein [Candidatus Bathyarchaeia archaeon]
MDIHNLEYMEPWEWPPNAAADILRVLRDKAASDEDRALAASFAGDFVVINDELAEELMAVVKDPGAPAEVRARAAVAFGPALEHSDCCDWSDEDDILVSEEVFNRMRQTLHEVYQDATVPKVVRRRALEGAVRAPEEWQKKAIRAAYAGDDVEWKTTAVFGMGYVPGFDNEILEALQSRIPEVQFEAVRAAGSREVIAAWPYIARLLRGGAADKELLIAAIEVAPYVDREEGLALLGHLAISKDEEIAEAASDAMGMAVALRESLDGEADWEGEDDEEYEEEDEDLDEEDKEDDDSF